MMDIEELRKKRKDYLIQVYALSKADIYSSVSMWELGTSMSLDKEETRKIVEYLKGEGLVKFSGMGGMISITHEGIKEVENPTDSKKEIKNLPQVNIVQVQKMVNSQIQQASNNSSQVYTETLEESKKQGRIAGIISIVICAIFVILVFQFGWDLTGQILTAFSALFGILGVGSLISPSTMGRITSQILHNISENTKNQ